MIIHPFKEYIVVDLDGTLADISHRVHLAQAKAWDDFHALAQDDKIIASTAQIVSALAHFFTIIVVTGRNERLRPGTEGWLQKQDATPFISAVLMRPDDDYRPDGEMKLSLLEAHFGSKQAVLDNVELAIDDRDRVVEAFRNYGLICWQVREGDY
jgi:hypothetical protein